MADDLWVKDQWCLPHFVYMSTEVIQINCGTKWEETLHKKPSGILNECRRISESLSGTTPRAVRRLVFNGGTCTWRSQDMKHVKGARNVGKKRVLFIGHKEGKVSVLFQGRDV